MHPLIIYKPELESYINSDFELEVLDDTCLFSEGPVWNDEGYYLFSDIPNNIINKIVPGELKEVYAKNSGCMDKDEAELPRMMGSNGLAYDAQKTLFICQHGNHCIAFCDGTVIKPLIATYQDKMLNSPNDIVIDEDGRLFFSDPPYGLADQVLNPEKYQSCAGLYCWQQGSLHMFWHQYQYPNGICLSPDGRSLYTCSNKPFEADVLEFDAQTLSLKRVVCREASDGIKCDRRGNLYLCNEAGIIIINQKGERLGTIQLPTVPANICWGGNHLNDLFITARQNIFLIRNLQRE